MHQEPTTREKVLASLEDASMYQELGQDARDHAAGAKDRWAKLRDRLGAVKQEHEEWRQGHKLSAWLHDNGWIKNTTLVQHEDRQRRYTTREADAHVVHVNARDEVRRLDKNLVHSQDQASAGWRQLEQEREQQEKAAQQRQEPTTASRAQQHEEASPSQLAKTTSRQKDDRFTGELLESGFAPYLDDEKNSRSYFVKLRLDNGKEAKHWGVDLERAVGEAGAGKGDRIHVQRTGENRAVEVEEEGKKIHTVRKGWEVTNLGHQRAIEAPAQVEPEGLHQAPAAEFKAPEHAKAPDVEHTHQPPTQQRQQTMTQDQSQTFGSVELPRTKQEMQQEQSRPNLGQRVMQNNIELPQPGRRPSLGEAARVALQPQQQQQAQDEQGQGSGGRRGGQDRPSHSSYYQPLPVGGMAPPTTDERSAAIQQQEKARRRSLSRSF